MFKPRVVVVALLLLFIFGMFVWLLTPSQSQPPIRLGTGALVSLHEVAYAKHHTFIYGSLWERWRSHLPVKWFGRSKAGRINLGSTNDRAIAWFVWKGEPEMFRNVPSYVLVNDRGERVMILESAARQQVDEDTFIDARPLILPRNSATLRFELYELDTNSHSVCRGGVKFANPAPKIAPTWKPDPLPVRLFEGNLEFTLLEFSAEKEVHREKGFATALHTLRFRIEEGGRLTTNWQLRSIQAFDALGNQNRYMISSYPDSKGCEVWQGTWLLWPDESAWKLRLEFVRRGDFASDELWHLPGIPVPDRPGYVPALFRTNLQGMDFLVRGISDARGLLSDGLRVSIFPNVLDITWTPIDADVEVSLLHIAADRGRLQLVGSVDRATPGAKGYPLHLDPSTRRIDAIIAVRLRRTIEFMAKPAMIE